MACPTCRKKVTDEEQGYFCINCSKNYKDAVPTYNCSVKLSDLSGSMACGLLGEVGDSFIGMDCKTFFDMDMDMEQLKNLKSEHAFKPFNVTIRAKYDTNRNSQDDSQNLRYNVIRVNSHSY